MKRNVVLVANEVAIDGGSGAIVPGTSPYPWASTANMSVIDIWNTGPIDAQYAFFWSGLIPSWAVGFDVPPTLARFTKVTIEAGFDYAQGGPNSWWFPPDNSHGPIATLIVRNRAMSAWISGTGSATYTVLGPPTDDYNVNMNTSPPYYKLRTLTWEMAAHPEGGPWTFDDLQDLAAGVSWLTSNGPNGLPWDPTGFERLRVPYLTVTLEVEDLGGDVAAMRFADSLTLRLMRRARDTVKLTSFAEHAIGDIGSRIYLSHPRGPAVGGAGWGRRLLERRAGIITKRTIFPETFKVEDEVWDTRKFSCLYWGAYRIDGPWSTELQGLALIDKGGGYLHTRAQDAWSPRPGDGVVLRVLEDYPNLSFHGLAVQGGGDEAICLRNYDLMRSGWATVASSGTFTATADTTVSMVEELGYLSSARLEYGAGGGQGGRERSLGTLPYNVGDRLHVRVVLRNTSVPTPGSQWAEVRLQRSGGGLPATEYWDEAGRQWTTTPSYNAVPSADVFGELVMDAIPLDSGLATSDPTYAIAVGRFSSNLSSVTFHGALVDVQHSDDTVAGARTPLVTLDAAITREPDVHQMPHTLARELWAHGRGSHIFEGRPFWRAEDLPADAVKPLLHAQHTATDWDALQFVPKTGSDDLIRFERALDGEGTYQLDCPIDGIELTRAHVLRAWVRYLGSDGWRTYAPYSVEVGYAVFLAADGTLVGQGSVLGTLSSTTAETARDYLGIGCDETRFFDGWVRMAETRRNPLHGLEMVWQA